MLREQAEHMDAPDRCSSLDKTSCTTGAVHTWLNGHIIAQLRACRGRPQHQVSSDITLNSAVIGRSPIRLRSAAIIVASRRRTMPPRVGLLIAPSRPKAARRLTTPLSSCDGTQRAAHRERFDPFGAN